MNINMESKITKYAVKILEILPFQRQDAEKYIISLGDMYTIKSYLTNIIDIEKGEIVSRTVTAKILRQVCQSLSSDINDLKEISQIINPDSMDDVKEIGDRQLSSGASDV